MQPKLWTHLPKPRAGTSADSTISISEPVPPDQNKTFVAPPAFKTKTRAVSLKQNRPGNLTRRRKLCSRRALREDILAFPRPAWHGEARVGAQRGVVGGGLLPGDGADPGEHGLVQPLTPLCACFSPLPTLHFPQFPSSILSRRHLFGGTGGTWKLKKKKKKEGIEKKWGGLKDDILTVVADLHRPFVVGAAPKKLHRRPGQPSAGAQADTAQPCTPRRRCRARPREECDKLRF